MPILIEKTYTTTNSNTYLTAEAFHDEHGPLGIANMDYILEPGTSELVNNQSIKTIIKYEDMAKYNEHCTHSQAGGVHDGKGGDVSAGSVTSKVVD